VTPVSLEKTPWEEIDKVGDDEKKFHVIREDRRLGYEGKSRILVSLTVLGTTRYYFSLSKYPLWYIRRNR